MNPSRWRWPAIALLAVNLVLLVSWLFSSPPEPIHQDIRPLDPALPRAELVTQVRSNEQRPAGCYTIGPLATLLAQQRAVDRLRPFTNRLRTRQTEADRDRGWWVYLPASSRNEAMTLTRRLAERGVEDYYVVAGGALENAVSVGLYEQIENARQRQRQIRELGFNAQLEVRRETVPQFWVDYQVSNDGEPPWRFIMRASPGAQRLEIPCFEPDPTTPDEPA